MKRNISLEEALYIHRDLINSFGGSHGVRDMGLLESALMRPMSGYYKDIIEEAAALMESLAMNHPFVDGNKRVAFAITDSFLRINGYFIDCKAIETYDHWIYLFEKKEFNFVNIEKWLRETVKQNKNKEIG
jgi:death-on-curing protein